MNGTKAWAKNLGMAAASVLAVFALSLGADWMTGRYATRPEMRGTMELILTPPRAEQTFTSVEFTYTVHVNSLGLRGRELHANPGVYRIAAIGDSFTYGWGVEEEQSWLRLLEKNLRDRGYNVETVNLGKPGAGPPAYADHAEKALPVVRPDLVLVVMHQGDDMAGSGREGLEKLEKQKRREGGAVGRFARAVYPNITRMLRDARLSRLGDRRTQEAPPQKSSAEDNRRWAENTARNEILAKMTPDKKAMFEAIDPRVREAFMQGMFNPYMVGLAMDNPRFYIMPMMLDDPWVKNCIDNMAGQLRRIENAAKDVGATVAVLTIPDGVYVNDAARKNITRVGYAIDPSLMTAENADGGVRRACEQAGLPFHTVSKGFVDRSSETDLFFELDSHPTPKGHALYADLITPIIERIIAPNAPRIQP